MLSVNCAASKDSRAPLVCSRCSVPRGIVWLLVTSLSWDRINQMPGEQEIFPVHVWPQTGGFTASLEDCSHSAGGEVVLPHHQGQPWSVTPRASLKIGTGLSLLSKPLCWIHSHALSGSWAKQDMLKRWQIYLGTFLLWLSLSMIHSKWDCCQRIAPSFVSWTELGIKSNCNCLFSFSDTLITLSPFLTFPTLLYFIPFW